MSRPIAITLGDPCGIGPEIVLACLSSLTKDESSLFKVFAHRHVLEDAQRRSGLVLRCELSVCEPECSLEAAEPGMPTMESGHAQVAYLEQAVRSLKSGECEALVTAPIHKGWAHKAGFAFPGHTEYLADAFAAGDVTMLFDGPKLKVALATVHCPLSLVPQRLTLDRLGRTIDHLTGYLVGPLKISSPRVGIVGLNPHAGESGTFGDEESRLIQPAMEEAKERWKDKVSFEGPLVPDAAFRTNCDAFVAMYHDQGLIAVKLLDFEDSVNVTLGLPIIRCSPDHGVAYDIAGQNIARHHSMLAAINKALTLSGRRPLSTS